MSRKRPKKRDKPELLFREISISGVNAYMGLGATQRGDEAHVVGTTARIVLTGTLDEPTHAMLKSLSIRRKSRQVARTRCRGLGLSTVCIRSSGPQCSSRLRSLNVCGCSDCPGC
jgi:hypothetical protein